MFDRKAYGQKYSHEKRERRKAEGRCVTCGVKLTFECTTLQCEHCREKQKYKNVAKVNISKLIAEAKADTVREIFNLVECAFSPALVYEGQTIKRYIAELEKKYAAGGAKMDGERSEKNDNN